MKYRCTILLVAVIALTLNTAAFAHFGMVIPSDNMVMQGESRTIKITNSFSHPMEMIGMEMAKPARFGVMVGGKTNDLSDGLKETRIMDHKAWALDYKIMRPGVYTFYMEPEPYWESSEDCYIIHYTKTVVAAFGLEEGWDQAVGLKTEIQPLTRPFGLYAGNLFQGVVLLDGKPVPHAEVEVEFYNKDGKAKASNDYMVTQVIRADKNGVFTYAVPRPGWWGFAALNISDKKILHEGKEKDVEIGAVIWVEFQEWREE